MTATIGTTHASDVHGQPKAARPVCVECKPTLPKLTPVQRGVYDTCRMRGHYIPMPFYLGRSEERTIQAMIDKGVIERYKNVDGAECVRITEKYRDA